MTNTKEPRQWWIVQRTGSADIVFDKQIDSGVHVIEYGAYKAVDESETIFEQELTKCEKEYMKIQKKLDVATAALENARHLVNSREYAEAFRLLDKALALINKTEGEK